VVVGELLPTTRPQPTAVALQVAVPVQPPGQRTTG